MAGLAVLEEVRRPAAGRRKAEEARTAVAGVVEYMDLLVRAEEAEFDTAAGLDLAGHRELALEVV